MCGICGFSWEDNTLIKEMMDSMGHRGPDDHGKFCYRDVSLGHRRLSIIDLSKKGRQPMSNEDGSIWITFNGEIYNHKKIREDLEKKGHKFSSNTDTEAIIHGYEQYGLGILKKLNGFFAFAIYDANRKQLFIARDRLGIKPLYYYIDGKEILFASEIKALLKHGMDRRVNIRALNDFLSYRASTIDQTMFEGIKKLMPGHFLIKNKDGINIQKYWDINLEKEYSSNINENILAKRIKEMLSESIKMRLMSDVPIGAYLSGGIDSGSVVGIMSEFMNEPVKTFSVGFGLDEHKDELGEAKLIAEHFETDHQEIIVDPDTINVLPKIVWHLDEPMSDPTCIPTYLLSEQAKKKCTVILTGEGADEQFGGYEQYKIMRMHKKIRFAPRIIRRIGAESARIVPKKILDSVFKYASGLGEEGMKRLVNFASTNNEDEAYHEIVGIFNEEEKEEIFDIGFKEEAKKNYTYERFNEITGKNHDYLNKIMYFETKTALAEDLLMKVDKNTMAFGIEARVPFLDHNIVEKSFEIPSSLKLKGSNEKYILRKAMEDIVPKSTFQRKKERFFVPIHNWFTGELKDASKELLSKTNIKKQGIFDYRYIKKAYHNYDSSKIFYSRQLFSLVSFSLWHKLFIEENFDNVPNKGILELI